MIMINITTVTVNEKHLIKYPSKGTNIPKNNAQVLWKLSILVMNQL